MVHGRREHEAYPQHRSRDDKAQDDKVRQEVGARFECEAERRHCQRESVMNWCASGLGVREVGRRAAEVGRFALSIICAGTPPRLIRVHQLQTMYSPTDCMRACKHGLYRANGATAGRPPMLPTAQPCARGKGQLSSRRPTSAGMQPSRPENLERR